MKEIHNVRATYNRVVTLSAAAVLSSIFLSNTAYAYTITAFDPSSYFTAGVLPTLGNTSALDSAAGINSGFLIEDFEDDALIAGLTVTFNGGSATSSVSASGGNIGRIQESGATWDGNRVLGTLVNTSTPTTFDFSNGADFFGIGISGFHSENEIVVNGQNLGAVNGLVYSQFTDNAFSNDRNIYLLISRDGDAPITDVSFIYDPLVPNISGDFVRFDHVAIASAVPVPAAIWLFGSGLLGLVGVSRFKHTQ